MAFVAADCLSLWEIGLDRHPIDRALLILAMAFPDRSPDELARLSVGQRDNLLMRVHQQMFGQQLTSRMYCPICREGLEFSLNLADVMGEQPETATRALTVENWQLTIRRLTSLDLAAIAAYTNVEEARSQFIQRCVVEARHGEEPITADRLPALIVSELAHALSEWDATADVQIELACPACHHQWAAALDILTFLWSNITARAKRLLQEVDWLARAYGWRETDILSLSDRRRQLYLEMVLNR